jgi:hypothetical protein
VLILLTTLFVLTKGRRGWTPFNYFRTALFYLLGIGTCLVLLLKTNDDHATRFMASPWLLPTLCLVMFVVLVLTHLPSPPPLFFRGPFGGRNSGGDKKGGRGRQESTASKAPLVDGAKGGLFGDSKGAYAAVLQRAYEHDEDGGARNPVAVQARDGNPYVADTAYSPDVYLQYQWYQQRYEEQQRQHAEEKKEWQQRRLSEGGGGAAAAQQQQQQQQQQMWSPPPQYQPSQQQQQGQGQMPLHHVPVHQVQVQDVLQQPPQVQQAQYPRYYYPDPPAGL